MRRYPTAASASSIVLRGRAAGKPGIRAAGSPGYRFLPVLRKFTGQCLTNPAVHHRSILWVDPWVVSGSQSPIAAISGVATVCRKTNTCGCRGSRS